MSQIYLKLILRWVEINLFSFVRQISFRIFCGFNIEYPGDVDVSFK